MRVITLEEHFTTEAFLDRVGNMPPSMRRVEEALLDLGEGRISAMDQAGIDVQVLSLVTNGIDKLDATTATSLTMDVNDELAGAVQKYPGRFESFATLAMKNPEAAAKELERCVSSLGFVGAMLDGTTDGEFYDQPKFLPVFEAAQALDVPIYLHPAAPPDTVKKAYFSGLSIQASALLSIAGWGWHAELGLHILRMIVSGIFEKLPNLRIIIGHMGEGVPYALERSSKVLEGATGDLPKTVADYFRQNVLVTTSGYFTIPPLRCAMDVIGLERLMFSVDYPFSSNQTGRAYIEAIKESGLADDAELKGLLSGTAEKVLKLKSPEQG